LERKRIFALITRRSALTESERRAEATFDEQAREKLLENSQYSRSLVERFLELYDTERAERRSTAQQLTEQFAATREVTNQAIETMQDYAGIARLTVDRQDHRDAELCEILRETNRTFGAVGYVLAKLYFRDDRGFQDLIAEIEQGADETAS